jgi:hypothetical protein
MAIAAGTRNSSAYNYSGDKYMFKAATIIVAAGLGAGVPVFCVRKSKPQNAGTEAGGYGLA